MAASSDGLLLSYGGTARELFVWEHRRDRTRSVPEAHLDTITALAFSPDDRTLASADASGNLKLWDLATLQELLTLDAHGEATEMTFTPDAGMLLATTKGGLLWHWNAGRGSTGSPPTHLP